MSAASGGTPGRETPPAGNQVAGISMGTESESSVHRVAAGALVDTTEVCPLCDEEDCPTWSARAIALLVAPSQPPRLPAYRSETGRQLVVWCEHEQDWHMHGRCRCDEPVCVCPTGTGDGQRAPHCRCPRVPWRAFGYFLVEVGPLTPDVKRAHRGASYGHGCRLGSCRLDRLAAKAAKARAAVSR